MLFLLANPDAPALRSHLFLWARNGAVILFLAMSVIVLLPPKSALAFWSVAAPGWETEIDALAQHVEWHLADESNIASQDYFDSFSSQIRYNRLYRQLSLSLTQDEKSLFAKYTNNEDLFNEPLRGTGSFEDGGTVNESMTAELDATLARSGSYEGVAYRVQKTNPEYIEGLEIDDLYTDTAFSSASIDFKAAVNPAGEDMSQTGLPKVIFKRILRTGNVVSDFRDGAVSLSNDPQIVSRPNTVFRVRGIAKVQSRHGEVTVVLEEEEEGVEGGLLKTNNYYLEGNVELYSGGKYVSSRGGRQARDQYEQAYNEDGTASHAGTTGGCPTS